MDVAGTPAWDMRKADRKAFNLPIVDGSQELKKIVVIITVPEDEDRSSCRPSITPARPSRKR